MNPALVVIAFLLLFGLWAVGMGLAWHRIDRLETDRRRVLAENRRLTDLVAEVCDERDDAETRAREWMAEADARAADAQNHEHVCLGTLTHNDSGVKR
jgi:hypothetical protein